MAVTPKLNLYKPAENETGWADEINGNWDTVDDLADKADKVSGATNGNLAGLDANGNLTDSGSKASDFVAKSAYDANNTILKADTASTPASLTIAEQRIVGRITGGNVAALTGTQATAILDNFVGDSGSGGTKGLVPAPSAGDSSKYLKGDGTWASPGGSEGMAANLLTARNLYGGI